MILVTGVTGRIGSAAAAALAERGNASVRVLVRDAGATLHSNLAPLQRVTGDLSVRDSLGQAMRGVKSALLVAPNGENQFELEKNFIDAASEAGVEHVVKISSMEAGANARAPIPQLHHKAEEYLRASGMDWTCLRPNFFLQNFLMYSQTIKAQQFFALPFAEAKIAPVDTHDIGAVAAKILGAAEHAGKSYDMTATTTSSLSDVAEVFSQVCEQPIRYIDQDPAEFRAFMVKIVPSAWLANAVADLFEEIRAGSLAEVSTDMADILGRAPVTTAAFVERYRSAFC